MAKRRAKDEGSIFIETATGLWVAELTLPDGSKRRKRSKKQQVVKEWLLQQKMAVREGLLMSGGKVRYDKFLDRYLEEVAIPTLRPKTVDSYRWLIESHIKPNLGHIPLDQIKPDHLQSLYAKKLNEGLSKRSVQYMHSVIRLTLNRAVSWELIARNPASLASAPTPERHQFKTLSSDHGQRQLEMHIGVN